MPNRFPKIELTDEEWMSVISQYRDGLPYCCANVSHLRDVLTGAARGDGEMLIPDRLRLALIAYRGGHDMTPVLSKIAEQMGWSDDDLADKHGLPESRAHEYGE